MRRTLLAWWFLWQAWTAAPFGLPDSTVWQFRAAGMMGPFRDEGQCEPIRQRFEAAQSRPWSLVITEKCWDSWMPQTPPVGP